LECICVHIFEGFTQMNEERYLTDHGADW